MHTVKELSKTEINELISSSDSEDNTILIFEAPWLSSSNLISIIANKLSFHYNGKLNFYTYHLERNDSFIEQFNIKKFPTLFILCGTEIISKIEGVSSTHKIKQQISKACFGEEE